MQWHMQAGNITTKLNVEVYFTLPALSSSNVMIWKFHVNAYANGRYDIILGIYILT